VTGAVSGLVVVDCDNEAGIAWANAHLSPTPIKVRTAKGEHWYYQHPGGRVRNKVRINTGDPAVAIDVKADGGYVVGPGSVHASGHVYTAFGDWSVPTSDLPRFDPAWLVPPDAH